jgi:ABC-2 type transport system ATP-binding protein
MTALSLTVDNVTFRYPHGASALHQVSFTAGTGITVVLGPNGAGKTTLFKIIANVLRAQQGDVRTDERDHSRRARSQIAYLPQDVQLIEHFTAHESVAYCAWLRGAAARECGKLAHLALDMVGLQDQATARVHTLSGGMKRRLGIGCALSVPSDVILLDEPMSGLDPAQRVEVRRLIQRLAAEAVVLLSTHVLQDIPELASEIVIMKQGAVAFQGGVDELLSGSAIPHDDSTVVAGDIERRYLELTGEAE